MNELRDRLLAIHAKITSLLPELESALELLSNDEVNGRNSSDAEEEKDEPKKKAEVDGSEKSDHQKRFKAPLLKEAFDPKYSEEYRFACVNRLLFGSFSGIENFCVEKYWYDRDRLLDSDLSMKRRCDEIGVDENFLCELCELGTGLALRVTKQQKK